MERINQAGIGRSGSPVLWGKLFAALSLLAGIAATGFAQMSHEQLKAFGDTEPTSAHPRAALIQDENGNLYGTTQLGGRANVGTVFKLKTDGSGFTVLHSFASNPDGNMPYGRLMLGENGVLCGTTVFGGSNGLGTIFTLKTNGSAHAVLHHFSTNVFDGQHPRAALLKGSDGAVYGTTTEGGTNGVGTLFKLNLDGTGFTLLHNFTTNPVPPAPDLGRNPDELVQGLDGLLYGTTRAGGASGAGTIFRIHTNGADAAVLLDLTAPAGDARSHHAGLMQANDGMLYGTFFNGNGHTNGSVFKVRTNGTDYAVLHSFTTNTFDGRNPDSRLIEGASGSLYGMTATGGASGQGTIFRINTNGTGFTISLRLSDLPVSARKETDGKFTHIVRSGIFSRSSTTEYTWEGKVSP